MMHTFTCDYVERAAHAARPSSFAYVQYQKGKGLVEMVAHYPDDWLTVIAEKRLVFPDDYVDRLVQKAHEGLPVFPYDKLVTGRGIADWNHAHSVKEAQIREWWTRNAFRYVGRTEPLGGMGVDVDMGHENGHDGEASMRGIFATHPALRDVFLRTQSDRTPKGGYHFEFWNPTAYPFKSVPNWWDGIDYKVAGTGMMIVPPSPGYTVLNDGARLDLPAEWIEAHEDRGVERHEEKRARKAAEGKVYALGISAGLPEREARRRAVKATGLRDGQGRRALMLSKMPEVWFYHPEYSFDDLMDAAHAIQAEHFAEEMEDETIADVVQYVRTNNTAHYKKPRVGFSKKQFADIIGKLPKVGF